jgi:hypothetical protein
VTSHPPEQEPPPASAHRTATPAAAPSPAPPERPTAAIDTPTGHWELGWDSGSGTLYAHHHSTPETQDTSSAGRPTARQAAPTHHLGTSPAEIRYPEQLEERLGFPLPDVVHDLLHADQGDRPTSTARPWQLADPQPAAPLPAGTRPQPDSRLHPPGGPDTTYQQAMHDSAALRTWEQDGYQVDIRRADLFTDPDTGQPRHSITYRLTHAGRVIFSGDDIDAPADIDPRGDDAIRAVVDLLCHRTPEVNLIPAQQAFLDAHADTITGHTLGPDPPYPPGTRVAIDEPSGTRCTGAVVESVTAANGEILAYAWRPDHANLPGHPWHGHPHHSLVTPAHQVIPTLAAPDTELPSTAPPPPRPSQQATEHPTASDAALHQPSAPPAPVPEAGL